MWLAAGSVPELGDDGLDLRHRARLQPPRRAGGLAPQGPSLPADARALGVHPRRPVDDVRRPRARARGPGASTSTATSPRSPGRWRCAVPVWSWPPRPTRSRGPNAWDLLYPAIALTNSQWWVQANQAGSHSTSTLLGASRIVAPTGTVVAEASRAVPGSLSRAELLVHRIDLHIAYEREGISGLLEDERHPDLYFDRIPAESADCSDTRTRLADRSVAVRPAPAVRRARDHGRRRTAPGPARETRAADRSGVAAARLLLA